MKGEQVMLDRSKIITHKCKPSIDNWSIAISIINPKIIIDTDIRVLFIPFQKLLAYRDELQYIEYTDDIKATSAQDYIFNYALKNIEPDSDQLLMIECRLTNHIASSRDWNIMTISKSRATDVLKQTAELGFRNKYMFNISMDDMRDILI